MTRRHECIDTPRNVRRPAACAAVAIAAILLAGCSSTVAGNATYAAASTGHGGGGPTLQVPSAPDTSKPGSGSASNPTSPKPSASPSATPSPSASPKPSATASPRLTPTLHGWHAIGHQQRGIVYDAPPNWRVESPSTIVGFEDAHGPAVGMNAAAEYKAGYCPGHSGSSRAGAGVAAMRGSDLGQAAHAAARAWARAAYEDGVKHPTLTIGKPRSLRVSGAHAVQVTATVKIPKPAHCGSPEGVVEAVAMTGGGANGIFVIYADEGISGAVPSKVLGQMVGSLRRYPA